jgi:hypothetical protein
MMGSAAADAATYGRRSRAARLGWIRRQRREEIQATIAAELDRLRDAGHGISFFWPTGKPMDRATISRFLYWSLVQSGAVQGESAIGYEALDDGR